MMDLFDRLAGRVRSVPVDVPTDLDVLHPAAGIDEIDGPDAAHLEVHEPDPMFKQNTKNDALVVDNDINFNSRDGVDPSVVAVVDEDSAPLISEQIPGQIDPILSDVPASFEARTSDVRPGEPTEIMDRDMGFPAQLERDPNVASSHEVRVEIPQSQRIAPDEKPVVSLTERLWENTETEHVIETLRDRIETRATRIETTIKDPTRETTAHPVKGHSTTQELDVPRVAAPPVATPEVKINIGKIQVTAPPPAPAPQPAPAPVSLVAQAPKQGRDLRAYLGWKGGAR